MGIKRKTLELYLNNLLEAASFQDAAPNGLQVQGRESIQKVATGVSASLDFLQQAIAWGAEALIVHHGYFWKNESLSITKLKYQRLRTLLINDVNLFAYHLPLDAHPELGNNAQLGRQLAFCTQNLPVAHFGHSQLGWLTTLSEPITLGVLAARIEQVFARKPLAIGEPGMCLQRVAWCTGAAQNLFMDAICAGADVYISGEISEPVTHLARESDTAYLAAGHHATERYGVQALGTHLAAHFGIEHRFIDIDNPV